MSTTRQSEIGHSQGKVGGCPFCRKDRAELWCEPSEMPAGEPFQVRCFSCGAAGPWARNGWEQAVPAWCSVVHLVEMWDDMKRASAQSTPSPNLKRGLPPP